MSDRKCLLVDFRGGDLVETWHQKSERHNFTATVAYSSSAEEAEMILNSGTVLTMVIFTDECTPDVNTVLKSFQMNVGCINEFQAIVCDDPHPKLLASIFEYGIEQYFRDEDWPAMAAAMSRSAVQTMGDSESAIAKTVNLTHSIRSGNQESITQAQEAMGDLAEFDFRAAYASGKASEAKGDYAAAILNYGQARNMNSMFKGAASSESEALLLTGQTDKALKLLKKLEAQNPYDTGRKATLASAYIEVGDIAQAAKYVKDAGKDAPKNSKGLEARAQVLLSTGIVAEAFKLIDQMSDVGPFFAAKLNELGIKLSKAGKSKSALAVYQKAHKVVKQELKHKISMNAALACRRLKAYDMALKYLARAEKEHGGPFDKLGKLRQTIMIQKKKAMIAKKKAAANGTKSPRKAG